MRVIGIDPGRSGGLVMYDGAAASGIKMPEDPKVIREFITVWNPECTFIERIPKWCGLTQFAARPIPGSSLAVLYGNFQLCVGICVGLDVRWQLVSPIKWQNLVGCRNATRLAGPAWKRQLRDHAQTFLARHVPLWMADALLIAAAGQKLLE